MFCIDPTHFESNKGGVYLLLAASFLPFAAVWWGDYSWWVDGLLFSVGVALLVVVSQALRLGYFPDAFAIELSDAGVRVPSKSRWASWVELSELRDRPTLKRVDILDHSGRRFTSLEYQLESFQDALTQTHESMRLRAPEQNVFRRSYRGTAVLGAGSFLILGASAWTHSAGLFWLATFLGAWAVWRLATGVRSVSFERDGAAITRWLDVRRVHWYGIGEIALEFDPLRSRIDVVLHGRTEDGTSILPRGSNPFHLCVRARKLLGLFRTQPRPLDVETEWREAPSLSSILHRLNHPGLPRPDPLLSSQLDSLLQRIQRRKRIAFYAIASLILSVGFLLGYSGVVKDNPIFACIALGVAATDWIRTQRPLHRSRMRLRDASPEVLGNFTIEQLRQCIDEVHHSFRREWGARAMPHVFLVDSPDVPAAVVRSKLLWFIPYLNAVYIDRGVLLALESDELQALVAHELAHFHRYNSWSSGALELSTLLASTLVVCVLAALHHVLLSDQELSPIRSPAVVSFLALCFIVYASYKAFKFIQILCSLPPVLLASGEGIPQEFLSDYSAARMFGPLPMANALLKLDLLDEMQAVLHEEVANVLATNTEHDPENLYRAAEETFPKGLARPEDLRAEIRRRLKPLRGAKSIFAAEFDGDEEAESTREFVRESKRSEKDFRRTRRAQWQRYDDNPRDGQLDATEWAAFVEALLRHDDTRVSRTDDLNSAEDESHPCMRDRILFLAAALPVDVESNRPAPAAG